MKREPFFRRLFFPLFLHVDVNLALQTEKHVLTRVKILTIEKDQMHLFRILNVGKAFTDFSFSDIKFKYSTNA